MAAKTEKTARGFGVYGKSKIKSRGGGTLRVQESSLAGEGAHVWLFLDGEKCVDHLGEHLAPSPQLNVTNVKRLIKALQTFVDAAEAGGLMEPARVEAP